MYIIGQTNDAVYQYTLSTAWDVSTATYASKSLSVGTQDASPTGIFFKSDGTAMYIIGQTNDAVYQYTLSTAWDVSTATYASKSFSVAAQEAIPTGIFFKSDGTAMYVVGYNTDTVYQYTLSTAWDVSTAIYASKSLSVGASPTGVFFKPDGTTMYIISDSTDRVYQYTLFTTWNYTAVSTAIAALSQPSSGYIALQEEDVDIITINTDLRAFISRDGGTTFTQATLAEVVDLGVQRILTATVDLTAQPAGTSMVYKIIASGDKKLLVHATSLQWN
jgi:DNA-binding beta-propeller fold protein YncE